MDVKTLCLGILSLGDASGYEIKKHFEEGPISYFHHAGFGSIYPALGKLLDEGLVTRTEMTQDGRPDKKVYALTANGLEAFRQALGKNPAPDKIRSESLFVLFFEHFLDDAHCRRVFDKYLEENRNLLELMRQCDTCGMPPGRQFVHGFGTAIYQATIQYMENNRHLLFPNANDERPEIIRKTGARQ